MDLEIIILTKPDRERQISYHSYVEANFLKNDTNELIYKTETDLQITKMVT